MLEVTSAAAEFRERNAEPGVTGSDWPERRVSMPFITRSARHIYLRMEWEGLSSLWSRRTIDWLRDWCRDRLSRSNRLFHFRPLRLP